jgi:hypothetical protein
MTLTTLISLNAALGTAAFYALVLVLGHGIRSERRHRAAYTGVVAAQDSAPERLAA